jgi:hypothetical protein
MRQTLRQWAQRRQATLWSLIVPPTVWSLHFLFCYVYAAIHCAKGGPLQSLDTVRPAIAAVTVIALLIVAASAYVSAQMLIEGDPPPYQESTDEDRHRFLAMAKLLLAALSFVAILYTAIPAFIFPDCR